MNQQPNNQPSDATPDDNLQQALSSIRAEAIPLGPSADLIAATLRALASLETPAVGSPLFAHGSRIVSITATAASLVLVVSLVAFLLTAFEFSSAAFADVFSQALKQVRETRSMSYVQQISLEGQPQPITTKEFVGESGWRQSELDGSVTVFDSAGDVRLRLIEPTHAAIIYPPHEDQSLNAGKMFLDWLDRLKKMGDKAERELGHKELEGKQVTGFVVSEGRRTFTMWVDDATEEPVRIEYDAESAGAPVHITLSDFRFHQPFDDSLFRFVIPAGYVVYGRPSASGAAADSGLKLEWSRKGVWADVAVAPIRPIAYGLAYGGRVVELNGDNEKISSLSVGDGASSLRLANLLADNKGQFLTFRVWGSSIEAHGADGALLWSYVQPTASSQRWTVDDVVAADLTGDGLDEVVIGFGGGTGLHVLSPSGKLLWKCSDLGNVWRVAADDVDGNGAPEVLATASIGKVAVFTAEGKRLPDIDPGFYPQTLELWQPADVAGQRLHAAVVRRNDLLHRLRGEDWQILQLRARSPGPAAAGTPPSETTMEAEFAKDRLLADLAAQLAELDAAIADARSAAKGNQANLASLRRQIDGLVRQIEDRKAEVQPDVEMIADGQEFKLRPMSPTKIDATLPLLEAENRVLQEHLTMTQEDVDRQFKALSRLDVESADLASQESQLDDLRAIIKRVGMQLSYWTIELEAEQRIRVVDQASRPQGDDARQRNMLIAFAAVAGFCLTLVLSLLLPRRRWGLVLTCAILLGGVSAASVWALVPLRFEAQALVRVSKAVPVILENVQKNLADDNQTYEIFKKTQLQFMKSNFVLSRAVRRPDMQDLATMREHKDDPVGYLERNLIVDYPGDAELMRVALKGRQRDDLPKIVNAVVDSYMDEIVSGDKITRLKQRDLLNQNYSMNQEKFRQLHDRFKKLAAELGASSSEGAKLRKKLAEERLEATVANARELTHRIQQQEIQIRYLKELRDKNAAVDRAGTAADPEDSLAASDTNDPKILELSRQLAALRVAIAEQAVASPIGDAARDGMRELTEQRGELVEKIERRKAELQPEIFTRLTGSHVDPAAARDPATAALLFLLETQRDGLEKNLAAAQQEVDRERQHLQQTGAVLILAGAGQGKVPLAALDPQGKTLWSTEIPAAVASGSASAERPWLALSLRDGTTCVIDLLTGKTIAQQSGRAGGGAVAWLPRVEADPLLLLIEDDALQACRVTAE
ncbi:MAG TPA: hypothetical protein VMF30_03930 [Pirellulales bacterium]|nr:hypothetical protein [Pirellulales bacterium]